MVAPISGKVCDEPPQAMTPRQRLGLLVGQRALDLGDDVDC